MRGISAVGILVAMAGDTLLATDTEPPKITGVTSAVISLDRSELVYPAQGGLATIYGSNLADGVYRADSIPLPGSLMPADEVQETLGRCRER